MLSCVVSWSVWIGSTPSPWSPSPTRRPGPCDGCPAKRWGTKSLMTYLLTYLLTYCFDTYWTLFTCYDAPVLFLFFFVRSTQPQSDPAQLSGRRSEGRALCHRAIDPVTKARNAGTGRAFRIVVRIVYTFFIFAVNSICVSEKIKQQYNIFTIWTNNINIRNFKSMNI